MSALERCSRRSLVNPSVTNKFSSSLRVYLSMLKIKTTAVSSRAIVRVPDTDCILEEPDLYATAVLNISGGGGCMTIFRSRVKKVESWCFRFPKYTNREGTGF